MDGLRKTVESNNSLGIPGEPPHLAPPVINEAQVTSGNTTSPSYLPVHLRHSHRHHHRRDDYVMGERRGIFLPVLPPSPVHDSLLPTYHPFCTLTSPTRPPGKSHFLPVTSIPIPIPKAPSLTSPTYSTHPTSLLTPHSPVTPVHLPPSFTSQP